MSLKSIFTAVLICLSFAASAQYQLSPEPGKFIQDVNLMLGNTKLETSIQVANEFSAFWTAFPEDQKKKIVDVSIKMVKSKKLRANGQFTDFFAILNAAKNKNLPSSQIDTILYITDKVITIFDGNQMANLFSTIRLFLEKGYVYKTNFNSLRISGGNFSFKYMGESVGQIDKYDQAYIDQQIKEEQEKANRDTSTKSLQQSKQDFFSDIDNPQQQVDEWGTIIETPVNTDAANANVNINAGVLDVGYTAPAQPPVSGAVIVFDKADFSFITIYDSTQLKGASGSLMLKNGLFVGQGGTFDWTIAGFTPSELYCELAQYNFPVKSTRLYSEGSKLHYPSRVDSVINGIFEFSSRKHKGVDDVVFPRFKSFASNINVKNLGPNIQYHGGFTLAGRKIYSSSIDEGYSTIEVMKGDTVVIKTVSNKFELGDSLIKADIASIVIHIKEDSIYHPGVNIKFYKAIPKLRASKSSGFKHAPFIDSYHKIEMTVDALIWDLNSPNIDLTIMNAQNQVPALFESEMYYQAAKYSNMQGMYRFHPLQMIIGFSEQKKKKSFFADELAKAYKFDVVTIKGAMIYLMKLGFIDYNIRTGFIILRPKASHYVMARRNKEDYDNLNLVSLSPGGSSSTLNIDTEELLVRGVDKVFLSDSLNVYIMPDERQVKFLKNRDFKFNGKINTENFQFVGTEFHFVYDSFLVHLPNISAIKLSVDDQGDSTKQGKKGPAKARVLGNELKYTSGTLYINKPHNKSARKRLPEYPIFEASSGATVLFNKAHIAGGAYDTTMQFKIPPFKIDSLSSDDPSAIGFDGEFVSGGIFPPFKQKLVVMKDFSLGFTHDVPKEGFPLYEGKAKFFNKITMNNQGLRGDGEIQYLTTTAYSKDFFFFKDSVITVGTKLITKEGTHPDAASPDVTFPDLAINEYEMKWLPRQDSMFITNKRTPFDLYNKTATLQGVANITAKGMFGEGVLATRGSETKSPNFHFEQTKFEGRHSTFDIKSDNPKKSALNCVAVKFEFDLKQGMAYFSPEVAGFASNSFPYAQYKSSLDKGEWDVNKKTVTMRMPEGGDINKSYFYSTRPDQDSLVFNATSAVYDIRQLTLNIFGIPYIKVADSKILPDSNTLSVQENAVIKTLENVKIIMDTVTQYHNLYNGSIDIIGRKKFAGEATYQYVNLGSDTLAFKFQDFNLQESEKKKEGSHTVATGFIKEEEPLRIADRVLYKGKITLHAENKTLTFDGFIRLDLKGALNFSEWLKYANTGESSEVVVDLTDPRAGNGAPLFNGLHLDNTKQLYTTFISQKKMGVDKDIMTAKGTLRMEGNEFKIGELARLDKKEYKGNTYSYNDSMSVIKYEGSFNFLEDKNDDVSLFAAGNGYAILDSNDFNFANMMSFKFKLDAKIGLAFGTELKKHSQEMSPDTAMAENYFVRQEQKKELLLFKLGELIGTKGVVDYKSKSALGYVPLVTLSSDLSKAIVFSDVEMKWSSVYKAWYSVGKINVSNILKTDINKEMNGYIEIRKTTAGDVVNIFLEPSPEDWYFISYEGRRLAMTTSSDEVNKVIASKAKGESIDQSKFNFVQADLMEKVKFVNTFKESYLGIHETQQFEQYQQEKKEEGNSPYPEEEERRQKERQDNPAYMNEEKKEYEKKEGTVIQEEEFNREKKEHSVEDKKQLQKDQQKMKDLFK
jgi:hypothetical protein